MARKFHDPRLDRAIDTVGVVIRPEGVVTTAAESPVDLSCDGVPTMDAPNGSTCRRRDGTAATTLYLRVSGAWEGVEAGEDFGATGILADIVDESTGDAGVTVDGVELKDGGITAAGQIDIDRALTAAGDGANLATTVNHASADAESLDATIAQLTAVRTSGAVVAVKAGATSLAADTGGTFAAVKAVSTDGGGTGPRHIAFEDGGGHDESIGTAPITGGGAGASTTALVIRSGARVKNDANAGVPTSGAVTVASGSTSQTTAAATGGASGAFVARSGATDVTFAGATGGASGAATIGSGDTDISAAVVATGGASGPVIVQSGDALSTGATATSGASGAVTVESGTSADANTGAVTVQSGAPAATGISGTVTIQSGATSGAGVSGSVDILTGTAPGGTRGDVNITGTNIGLNGIVVMDDSDDTTGAVVQRIGPSATEGWERRVYEETVSPSAVETALLTLPVGHIVEAVWANAETALTGGGTTFTWSLGITGDVDLYGTASADDGFGAQGDSLAQNGKYTRFGAQTAGAGDGIGDFVAGTEAVKLIAAVTGGATAGDTALTVGSVKVRVQYLVMLALDDAV